jgi:hypothetical protein
VSGAAAPIGDVVSLQISASLGLAGKASASLKAGPVRRELPALVLRLDPVMPTRRIETDPDGGKQVLSAQSSRGNRGGGNPDVLKPADAGSGSDKPGAARKGIGRASGTLPVGAEFLAALDQPETPVPFDPQPAGTVAPPAAARAERSGASKGKARADDLPDLSAETWRMAPIRWGGNTSTGGNYFQTSDGSKSLNILNTLNVQANSFIVAPYIAQWSGMFGANSTATTFTPATGSQVKSDSSAMNYGASVNVFPLSRFPLSATINHGTSLAKTADSSSPTSSTTLGLRQQYRTEDGRDNYALSYNRTSLASQLAGTTNSNVSSSVGGSFATSREVDYEELLGGNHSFGANFATSSSNADLSGQKSQVFNVNANHGWVVHEDLSISSMATFARNQIQAYQGNLLTTNSSNVLLANSGFTWRPLEDLPLTLTGGGNFSRTMTESANTKNELQSLGGFVATSYRFNSNLSASGNVSLTSTTSSGISNVSNTQNANVSYSGDPILFMGFNYGWGAGAGLSRSASNVGGSVTSSASASHNIGRAIVLSESHAINLSASQNISQTSGQRSSTSLSNMAAAAWRANYGEKLTGSLSANVIDTVTTAVEGNNHFRSASLVGNGTYQISSRASLTLNANLSWSQTVTGNGNNQALNGLILDTAAPTISGSLFAGYSHQSPFSIRNLTYNANLLYINSISNQQVVGGSNQSGLSQASQTFQQAVDYRLGRLSFRLNHSMINQAGRTSTSLFGSVNRDFDGFFDGRW